MDLAGVQEGQSGYFSAPSNALDPRLFDGDHIRAEVRAWVLQTLYSYWQQRYRSPMRWSTVWIAGSGISYQWSADRGNGDLDILIGVDWPAFFNANPSFQGVGAVSMSERFNAEFHTHLWPATASTTIGTSGAVNSAPEGGFSGTFEVTFYVNSEGTDICDLHPYAAYNLSDDVWTVRPPVLPHDPQTLYPTTWWEHIHAERNLAESLVQRYHQYRGQAAVQQPGSPGHVTTSRQLRVVRDQISALYEDIHTGRRAAFSEQGQGYGDYTNFRWQAHKRFGTQQSLHAIWSEGRTDRETAETTTYGLPLANAGDTLRAASLWNRAGR